MNGSLQRRRLFHSATSLLPQYRCHFLPSITPYLQNQERTISLRSLNPFKRRKSNDLDVTKLEAAHQKNALAAEKNNEPTAQSGDLAPGSIFDDQSTTPDTKPSTKPPVSKTPTSASPPQPPRNPHTMAAALDPKPTTRKRWQRKQLIRQIRGRNRLSKTELIARTERQHLSKSPWIKTSVKKLYPLARQIAGKPLREAMVQMRFSKKKAAGDILKHLEYARDQAVVVRGMGLGKVNGEGSVKQLAQPGIKGKESKQEEEGITVEDKKGKKRVVTDSTSMYIDEAWVGRGKYESGSDHRAFGKIHRLRLPYTSISVVLKEEATRIRQMQDREEKRARRKVWVPLPDRPVTAQRQYPLW